MQNFLTVVVILAMIAVGVVLINRLNGQHGERIAMFHFSRFQPGARRRSDHAAGAPDPRPEEIPGPAAAPGTRRDHRDGGRGRTSRRPHLAHSRGHGRGAGTGGQR